MKLPWFHHTKISARHFVIALVPDRLFGGKATEGYKVVVNMLLLQMGENSDTRSALLLENELQQFVS